MKYITRFFTISLLAAAIIIPFFLKTENGRPTLAMPTVDDFIPDQIVPEGMGSTSTSGGGSQTFYKWQDEKGRWHYGDQPPANVKNLSNVEVNTNANIISAVKTEPEMSNVQTLHKAPPKLSNTLTDGKLTVDDAVNVMSDAKAVRDMMESRNEALKSLTGE